MAASTDDLTFGVEFEGILISREMTPREMERAPSSSYIIRSGVIAMRPCARGHIDQIHGIVYEVLERAGVDIHNPRMPPHRLRYDEDHPNAANTPDAQYLRWTLKEDSSVELDEEDKNEYFFTAPPLGRYSPVNFELTSPALTANEGNIGYVQGVIQKLTSKFFVLTPKSAGLHVHIGVGNRTFDLRELQNIAAMAFMADCLLTQLHPDHRQNNQYCQRQRYYSRLAQGAGALGSNGANQQAASQKNGWIPMWNANASVSPESAFQTLLQCDSPGAVAWLMRNPDRGAYNFRHYEPDPGPCNLRDYNSGSPGYSPESGTRTVEFRQAAGTVNDQWIGAYLRVLFATVRLAVHETPPYQRLGRLVFDLQLQEQGQGTCSLHTFLKTVLRLHQDADYILTTTPEDRADPSRHLRWRLAIAAGTA
jgi:hypothetical protein